jgi:TetR/AcrR family transcriptional regulator
MNEPSPTAGRTRQRRKSARPQELLDAALGLFVEKGLAGTRAEDVAARAGVSKGTLYLYYPSKDELFKAVVRHHLTDVIVVGEDIAARHTGSAAQLLHDLALTWWRRVGDSQAAGLLVVMLAEAKHFPELAQFYVDEVVAPSHALVAKAIQYGIDRGEFRPMDVMNAVQALVAPLQFLIIYRESTSVCAVSEVSLTPEVFIHNQIELLLHGLNR